ncbi:hypothetical protein [Thalassotalea ganghwensis]
MILVKLLSGSILMAMCAAACAADIVSMRYVLSPKISCDESAKVINVIVSNYFSQSLKLKESDLGFNGELKREMFSVVDVDDIYLESISDSPMYNYFKKERKLSFTDSIILKPGENFTFDVSLYDFYELKKDVLYLITIFKPNVKNELDNEIKRFNILSNTILFDGKTCRTLKNEEIYQLIEKSKRVDSLAP